jgi:putative heme-binding domain-containing protein
MTMPSRSSLERAIVAILIVTAWTQVASAQKPAPVEDVSSFPPRSPEEEHGALHVPPGFEIQLVAADPDIHKPLNLAFDDKGRLWVTDTLEYPYPAPAGKKPRDTVKILSDFGPDGKARSIETFADGLNIPIGLLPLPSANAALVHSIPDIFLLRDSDGDGRVDSREVLYGVFGHRDTHGMTNAFTWGFDGWVYACHGYSNDSTVRGKDRKAISMNSGNTYRMRSDGSHAEYITHGQVNPFGLAFDPLGNLYSSDCHSRPVYQLLRGAWYPSFGKPHDGLGYGPEMVNYDHGSTGIAGISYYAADQFPPAYRDTIYVGNVVTNRINHDKIDWHGSTPKGIEQPDFVWSEDNWFRPVDIELGPDGALYVADFYNRIIGHYEVPLTHPGRDRSSGRIWRIVYKGPDGKLPPPPGQVDRTKSTIESLVSDLSDPDLAVRISAANQLVDRGGETAVRYLRGLLSPFAPTRSRVHAMWVLNRMGQLDEASLLACATLGTDPEIRVHGLKVFRERPELSDAMRVHALGELKSRDAFVRRAAAEALGGHPAIGDIKPLLALRQTTAADDTHLLHVVRMALRDHFKAPETWSMLETLGLSERDRRDLADVATGVPSPEAAGFLLRHIRTVDEGPENLLRYAHHVARHGARETRSDLLSIVAGRPSPAEKLALLKSIQQGLQERGDDLGEDLRRAARDLAGSMMDSKSPEETVLGIEVARDFTFRDALPQLKRIVDRKGGPGVPRIEALKAIVVLDPSGARSLLTRMLVDESLSRELRESAAMLLANQEGGEARAAIVEALPTAPSWLQDTLAAHLARRREGAQALLSAIEAGKASARLLQQRRITIGLESSGIPNVSERIASLLKGLPPADQKLRELMDRRRAGFRASSHDLARGAKLYEKSCGICHQLEGKGAKVGPQLDGIGSRGLERLMEDVLDPNRNVDQSFRVTNLALQNGQVVSGLLLREEGEVLIVADSQGKEVRVPRASVEERSTAQLSPMPANMAEQLPEPEFYDLMNYLLEHREKSNPK